MRPRSQWRRKPLFSGGGSIPNEELKKKWAARLAERVVGKVVTAVRYMTDEEVEDHGWRCAAVMVQLEDGTVLYPSRDDEGSNAGALFTNFKDLGCVPVI